MRTIKNNWKVALIVAVGIIAIILLGVFCIQSSQNRAFTLEEQVNTADSDIKVQEKRRVDLVYNLANCVKQYDKHEAETLTAIVEIAKAEYDMRKHCHGCFGAANNDCLRCEEELQYESE